MAGKLRSLRPSMEPSGRIVKMRELVGGDPRQSRLVEVRLGGREDRADFAEGFCRARRKGSFEQCGRRPARNAIVCGAHGGGHSVRQRDGTRLSPQEAGRLSGLARRIKRDGRVDLAQLPTCLPWLQERVGLLRDQPELLALQEDVIQLTAIRDLILSGRIDIEIADLVRVVAVLVQVKTNALRTKLALEAPGMIHPDKVQAVIASLVELLETHVPAERKAQVGRELVRLGASPAVVRAHYYYEDGAA